MHANKPEYDSSVKSFPAALCSTCKFNLYHCARDVDWQWTNRSHPREKWDKFQLSTERYDLNKHDPDKCQICQVAKWTPVGKTKGNYGKPRVMSTDVSQITPKKKIISKKICIKCKQ